MINVAKVLRSPHLSKTFDVYRKPGHWDHGRWIQDTEIKIVMVGVVTAGGTEDIIQVPEGDRTSSIMCFHSTEDLYITHSDGDAGTSDEIEWNGNRYKIIQAKPWKDYGFYRAIGVSMEGD